MINLIHGDCLEKMKDIPDCSIDLVVTSPPYDNLRTYNDTLNWSFDIFKPIARELTRVLKYGGVIVWIVNDATVKGSETGSSFRQALYFKNECGLNLHDTMIWDKGRGCPFQSKNRYISSSEFMFVLCKGSPLARGLLRDVPNKRAGSKINGTERQKNGETKPLSDFQKRKTVKQYGARSNIWRISPCKSNSERCGHSAQFPELLAHDHIVSWSNECDTVLDPFMGGGTTGVAAKNLNRKFIGIEKDENYFNIAEQRIKNCLLPLVQESNETCSNSTENETNVNQESAKYSGKKT